MTASDLDAITHRTIAANGIRFHIAEAGPKNAPLLLCLHGFPECWYSWRHVLLGLSHRLRVVAPDLRGYGQTDKPPCGYDLDTLADDAHELVRALGYERCTLAGHDWGGAIAYHAARRHAAVVERLVVMNCPHPAALRRHVFTNPRQIARFWYFFLFQLPYVPEWYLAREGGRAIAGAFKTAAARPDAISKEDRDVFRRAMLEPGAIPSALAYYRHAFRSGFSLGGASRARPIAAPTLVLWGMQDPALGVELTHGMEKYFSGPFLLQFLPDVGHWTQQEAPREVCAAMSSFLAISV